VGEYIDMQAAIGITKHQGGLPATRRLLELCHIEDAREVLDVGCGIGVGPAYIARTHACHVVAVDQSPHMIEWARRRVREEGVADRVELRVADVLDLPFDDDRFDVVIAESVLAFVGDKSRALQELVRVTRPGGHVGLNEFVWLGEMPEDVEKLAHDIGTQLLSARGWRALMEASGLGDCVAWIGRLDPALELRSRMRWVGMRWLVRAWARAACLLVTSPATRRAYRTVAAGTPKAFDNSGCGLFVGRKGRGQPTA
jgi:SAM-dependent methyltransferase